MAAGIKRRELAPCGICGKGLCEGGALQFFRVRVEQFVINPSAVRQAMGLEMTLTPRLAEVMGPDEDLAKGLDDATVMVCQACAVERTIFSAVVSAVAGGGA